MAVGGPVPSATERPVKCQIEKKRIHLFDQKTHIAVACFQWRRKNETRLGDRGCVQSRFALQD